MPEIAEVETVRKHLEKILDGKKIKDVEVDKEDKFLFAFAPAGEFKKALTGAKVVGSGRKGKYFWLELNRRPWPIFHLGMTGNVAISSPKLKGRAQKIWDGLTLQSQSEQGHVGPQWFCRLLITMADGTEVAFKDPRRFARLWLSDNPLEHPRIKKLGYDPLLDFPAAARLKIRLARRKAPIKAVLLDQSIFAGIGNYLADEILFQARFSPHRLASQLSLPEIRTLRKAILSVVRKAAAVDADYERFPKTWLFHHRWGKSKTAKISRGDKIIHEEIGGRTSAWVPTLQK